MKSVRITIELDVPDYCSHVAVDSFENIHLTKSQAEHWHRVSQQEESEEL